MSDHPTASPDLVPDIEELEATLTFLKPIGKGFQPASISCSYGNLATICRVLDDYARLLDLHRQNTHMACTEPFRAQWYICKAESLRSLSDKLAVAIGLDKTTAEARCERNGERAGKGVAVGEDGFTMAAMRANHYKIQSENTAQEEEDGEDEAST